MPAKTMLKRSIAALWQDTEGSALVEAAVVMPMIIPLVLGVLEFSWYFHKQQLVESGVRDAARYLARTSAADSDANPCNNATSLSNAQSIAVYGVITGGGTARVPGWTTGSVIITCPSFPNTAGSYLGATTIYRVTVTTTFVDPALGFFTLLNLTVPNLSASHTERSIGGG
jgi:Flp pilus assembly protein TadG